MSCDLPRFARLALLLGSLMIANVTHGPAVQASPIVFDAAADFSLAGNPNDVWSYGYSATLGGTMTLYADSTSSLLGNSNFEGWVPTNAETSASQHPFVAYNTAATTEQVLGLRLPAGGLGLHSGPDAGNAYSIVRWTAPADGMYDVSAAFTDRDFSDLVFGRGATTDVHVLINGASVYDAIIDRDGWGIGPTGYLALLSLGTGDRVDFLVGRGQNNTIGADSTGLDATISRLTEVVPEPSSLTLALLSLAFMTLGRLRVRGR